MVTVSCVLFIGMGLSGEIQQRLGFSSKILSCPKCCTFWCALVLLLAGRNKLLPSVAVSFGSSYAAMWLALALDALAVIYNKAYEKITKNPGAAESADPEGSSGSGQDGLEAGPADEVPQMQIRHDTL